MPIEIIVPRLGWSMEEGVFVAWLKKNGELVRAGEPLFSLEGDKAIQEIESIDSGILRLAADGPKPGDSIRVGVVLGHIVSADEAALESPCVSTARAVAKSPPNEASSIVRSLAGAAQVRTEIPARPSSTPVISPRALRVAAELGVEWTKVTGTGRTGRIRERDIRAAASMSHSRNPLHSPELVTKAVS